MICLSANKQGADILLDYLGGTLDPARKAELESHVEACAECRELLAVSTRMEEWSAPPVSSDFDARLYARIAREETARPWWKLLWRPAVPLAAACAVLALALVIDNPGLEENLPTQPGPAMNADIEQVEQAFEDLELLMPLNAAAPVQPTPDKM